MELERKGQELLVSLNANDTIFFKDNDYVMNRQVDMSKVRVKKSRLLDYNWSIDEINSLPEEYRREHHQLQSEGVYATFDPGYDVYFEIDPARLFDGERHEIVFDGSEVSGGNPEYGGSPYERIILIIEP